jgi:uncharacterized protein YdhG (YjbR/CyaY superfamily)
MPATKKSATSSTVFSDAEKSAMRERAKEQKAEAKRGAARADGEADLLSKIAEMPDADRAMAERIHALVTKIAPDLFPKTWYGMPAYANDAGKIVCFFQPADKFKYRYATFGFNEDAKLDEGTMWPTAFALTKLTAADEQQIGELVKKAVS